MRLILFQHHWQMGAIRAIRHGSQPQFQKELISSEGSYSSATCFVCLGIHPFPINKQP